jgi:hypothetical protein
MMDNRASVVKKLMHHSRKVDYRPDSYQQAATFFTRCAKEIALVRELATTTGHLLCRLAPPCFSEKCVRIEKELQRVSRKLTSQTDPVLPATASLVIEMLAVEVGRLSLDPFKGKDEYAVEMDLRAEKKDYEWKQRHADDEDVAATIRGVFKVSFKLRQPIEGCPCCQCVRRRDPISKY